MRGASLVHRPTIRRRTRRLSGLPPSGPVTQQGGYNLAGSDASFYSFVNDRFTSSSGSLTLNKPIVGIAN